MQVPMKSILILTPFQEHLEALKQATEGRFEIHALTDYPSCLQEAQKRRYDILFFEITCLPIPKDKMIPASHFERIFQELKSQYPTLPLMAIGSSEQTKNLVQAVRAGADRYLTTPLESQALQLGIARLQEKAHVQGELEYLRNNFWSDEKLEVTKTYSPVMKKLFFELQAVAPTDSTVLLLGESGVGKGVLAKFIHRTSARAQGPFVHVHCGAIPENLIESELFGHEKGAFTGATSRKLGRFEIARKGTIFLDEIGTISLSAQTKLLQVLQDNLLIRVGGESMIETDTRVIAATNNNLLEMSRAGSFREDLYYRLNVFPLTVPPLRERLEDIPILAENCLNKLQGKYQKRLEGISPETLRALRNYDFPGNIRELENILERAYILEKRRTLSLTSLPLDLAPESRQAIFSFASGDTLAEVRQKAIDEVEKAYLHQLLSTHKGRVNLTAETAGLGVRQLRVLMQKHHLKKEAYK